MAEVRTAPVLLVAISTVEDSLRRLDTDRIDLYQIHMQDIDTPEEETLRALDDLVHAGKVLYLGASNYAAYRLADSQWISKTEHLHRFVALQMQYSLVTRDLEREHIPACKRFGLGVLPWSPLAGGFLSGKFLKDQPPPAGTRLEKWKERLTSFDNARNWRILDAVKHQRKQTRDGGGVMIQADGHFQISVLAIWRSSGQPSGSGARARTRT
jgi:aryl-alcohol dehydrogenase-like predicted oxidoreductase